MKTIHLQGIGLVPAVEAGEIKAGDRLMWNYGFISEVLEVTPNGKASVVFTVRASDGRTYERVCRKNRLVARVPPPRK